MRVKRLLIVAPLVLAGFLLQSYAWVPTYDRQTTGNPERLTTYLVGRIGDAKILNPALNADAASSEVVGHVFESVLDLDEDLELRGRLAERWEVSERASLAAIPGKRFPDGAPVTAAALAARIEAYLRSGRDPELSGEVTAVRQLAGETRRETRRLPRPVAGGDPEPREVAIDVRVPERVELMLSRVDPALFERLEAVVGPDYLEGFPYGEYVRPSEAWARDLLRPAWPELLPLAEHNPVIVFHLRRGVRFHDGHEVDSGDVRFTWQAILDPRNLSPRTSDFEPIKLVETPDRHTARVVYKRLFSPAIYPWSYMGILPEHLLDEAAMAREMERRGLSEEERARFGMRDSEFNRHPVGAGRFRFVEWKSDEYVHLERNDDYWEGPAEFQEIFIRIIPDPLTQELEFRTGAIDQYVALPHQAARYRDDARYLTLSTVGSGYSYIGYNLRRPPFDDPRVRRALGMALDVQEIIDYILFGEGERVTGPYPINTPWYDHGVEPLPYDPEAALALLAEAGFAPNAEGWLERQGRTLEFNLITNNGNPIRKNVLTIAQNAWKKIGVRCNTQLFEWAVFLEDFVNKGEFDAVVLGWGMGIDPDLYQLWHSSQADPYELNFVGYRSPESDELIERIRAEYSHERQVALAHALHRRIASDQPYTFLFASRGTTVLDRKIAIVERDPATGAERYRRPYVTARGTAGDYFHKLRKLEFAPEW